MREQRTAVGGAPRMGNCARCRCGCGRVGLWEGAAAGWAGQGAIEAVGGHVGGRAEAGRWEGRQGRGMTAR